MKQKLTEAQIDENMKMLEFILDNVEQTDEMKRLLKEFELCMDENQRKIIVKNFERELDRAVGAKTGKFYIPENNN